MDELITLLTTGGWVAFAGFGVYLAYKLCITAIISYSVVKVCMKIVDFLVDGRKQEKQIRELCAAAGKSWPLSPYEWQEIIERARVK